MKKIALLAVVFCNLFLFGCNKHQFIFIESQPIQNDKERLLTANDSLEIQYNFSGENIPIKITIKNKSEKPVYIDWKKSVVIIDGKKYDYWNENSHIELSGSSYPLVYSIHTNLDGTIIKDERITYIAPHSYIETTRIYLQTSEFSFLPENDIMQLSMHSQDGPVRVKQYNFTEENSPLIFRSLLTLSSKEISTDETLFESTFWVSKIVESPSKNLLLQPTDKNNGESITYAPSLISSKTEFGKTAGPISLLGITLGLIYLSAENGTE